MKINPKKGAPKTPRNIRFERTWRIRREQVRSRRETFLRNLLYGRQRNIIPLPDVPFKVIFLSSDEKEIHPAKVNQDPPPTDERSGSACSLLDSAPSKKEATKVAPNLPEAVPTSRATGLSREQLEALFDESSSEDEENANVPFLFAGRGQYPDSPAPGEPRPASTAGSSRIHPSSSIQDRMQ